ncbi:MAG: ABC transporter ATP-binding protein [Solobacterium sp.]|nr:ABC transporter ATP-binding protein [Solobacterium sp.]
MLLNLQGIYKSYGGTIEVPVLKNVSIQVEEGEYVAIMGPSGSGKTTLMNIIGCLDRCTEGTYELDGADISRISENELSEVRLKKIGFVFQTFELLPGETAIENVALPLVYAGVPKAEREKAAVEALTKVGLGERVNFKPNQLSGGQKQRVAIARALINHPRILLADEPTGALDQKSGKQVMELFEELNKEGVTIVMITHDAHVASKAKRVIHIIDGMIQEGTHE